MKSMVLVLIGCGLLAATSAATPLSGRLCIGGQCGDYSCGDSLTAAAAPRTFIFSPSRAVHVLGTLPAAATNIPCDQDGVLQLRVRLLERVKTKRVPLRILVSSGDGAAWQVEGDGRELDRPITIRMSRGSYEITVATSHYVSYRTSVRVDDAKAVVTADLRPMRTIDGLVVDRATRVALAGAKIAGDNGDETITGRNGRFALEVDPERWPKQLMVRASGYGIRALAVPSARANTSLDEIALVPGATVVAEIHETEPGQVTQVQLMKLERNGVVPGAVLQTQTLQPSTAIGRTEHFENVEPGLYAVLASGAKPTQRAGERIEVREGDPPPLHLQLTPYHLRLRPVLNGSPLSGAHIVLRQFNAFWEIRVETDSSGEATLDLWQGGRLSATVGARGSVPYRDIRTIAETVDTDWILEMPRFEVVGKVIDADTGAPVPNASIMLDMSSPKWRELMVSATADRDGEFRFAPVFPGKHTIRAAAKGYPPSEEVTYSFGEAEESHSVTIVLQHMSMTMLTVVDARGVPVEEAEAFVFRGETSVVFTRTAAGGKVPVFVPDGEAREVFVVPRDGSLGMIRIQSGAAEQTMSVADGTSRITVRMESESHEAIPDMTVDISYNGYVLPDDVLAALRRRGSRTESGTEGRILLDHIPPGIYEFWPLPFGLRRARLASRAPLRLMALPGENVAVMTFAAAK